jgi:hypothetical protein
MITVAKFNCDVCGITDRAVFNCTNLLCPAKERNMPASPASQREGKADWERIAKEQRANEPGLRYDKGKPRWDLLPADALEELVLVYTRGAEKYAERNWEKGMSWSRCFRSMLSHTWKWWGGEQFDDETGLHHLAHVAWNALALVAYEKRKVGTDDRPGAHP